MARETLISASIAIALAGCTQADLRLGATGPYVQRVTATSAVVAAVTLESSALRLRLAGREVVEPEASLVHGLTVTDLEPGRRYFYTLETEQGDPLGSGQLETAPAGGSAPCTFLVSGCGSADGKPAGCDARTKADLVRIMQRRPAQLILHVGGLLPARGPSPVGAIQDFLSPFGSMVSDVPVYPALAEPDVGLASDPLAKAFFLPENGPPRDRRAYSFDWGRVHFVCLDPLAGSAAAQLDWLERDLAQTQAAAWTVVFLTAPAETAGSTWERMAPQLTRMWREDRFDLLVTGRNHRDLFADAVDPDAHPDRPHFLEVTVRPGALTLRALDACGTECARRDLSRT